MYIERKKATFSFGKPRNLSEFERKTGIYFFDKNLLKQAFTHRSYLNENKKTVSKNNERLEFLGDSVIQLIITLHLYKKFPNKQEGELTNFRSALVNTDIFGETANDLGMNEYILLSKGQKRDTEQSVRHILADTFEAFAGALYLDQGYNAVETFISSSLFQRVDGVVQRHLYRDWKSVLQEKAQKHLKATPEYQVLSETGPPNDRIFLVEAKIGERSFGQGSGKSKKDAEKQAAYKTLKTKGWL